VEALLAAAASPVPPPVDDLVPDPLLRDDVPADLPWLLRLLRRADLYLQDEVEVVLHPTLTRVWCHKGRRGQRLVEAPGNNAKQYGFGLVDWRDGWFDWQHAPGRRAAPLCAQLRGAVERSQARGRPSKTATSATQKGPLVYPFNVANRCPAVRCPETDCPIVAPAGHEPAIIRLAQGSPADQVVLRLRRFDAGHRTYAGMPQDRRAGRH
jgi:hypothetical protein